MVPMYIGTPPQGPFYILMDTGSTSLAVASQACGTNCGGVTPVYTPGSSSSSSLLSGTASSTYGGGNSWSGQIYRDNFRFGAVGNSVFPMEFAAMTSTSSFFGTEDCNFLTSGEGGNPNIQQGIGGLAYPSLAANGNTNLKSFFDYAFEAGILTSNSFALQLCETTGNLWLGGYDSAYIASGYSMQYVPIAVTSPYYYSVYWTSVAMSTSTNVNTFNSLGFSASQLSGQCDTNNDCTIVDSGTTEFYMPTAVYNSILAQLQSSTVFTSNFGSASTYFTNGECNQASASSATLSATLPKLQVTLSQQSTSNGATDVVLTLDPIKSYLTKRTITQNGQTGDVYCPSIFGQGGTALNIMGWAVISNFITHFDKTTTPNRVGFAPINTNKCGVADTSNQVPASSSVSPSASASSTAGSHGHSSSSSSNTVIPPKSSSSSASPPPPPPSSSSSSSSATPPPPTPIYSWSSPSYSTCTSSCGGGLLTTSTIICSSSLSPSTPVDDSYCSSSVKPPYGIPCNYNIACGGGTGGATVSSFYVSNSNNNVIPQGGTVSITISSNIPSYANIYLTPYTSLSSFSLTLIRNQYITSSPTVLTITLPSYQLPIGEYYISTSLSSLSNVYNASNGVITVVNTGNTVITQDPCSLCGPYGECDTMTSTTCHCVNGYSGNTCSTPPSSPSCSLLCNTNGGTLSYSTCTCECNSGWSGVLCDRELSSFTLLYNNINYNTFISSATDSLFFPHSLESDLSFAIGESDNIVENIVFQSSLDNPNTLSVVVTLSSPTSLSYQNTYISAIIQEYQMAITANGNTSMGQSVLSNGLSLGHSNTGGGSSGLSQVVPGSQPAGENSGSGFSPFSGNNLIYSIIVLVVVCILLLLIIYYFCCYRSQQSAKEGDAHQRPVRKATRAAQELQMGANVPSDYAHHPINNPNINMGYVDREGRFTIGASPPPVGSHAAQVRGGRALSDDCEWNPLQLGEEDVQRQVEEMNRINHQHQQYGVNYYQNQQNNQRAPPLPMSRPSPAPAYPQYSQAPKPFAKPAAVSAAHHVYNEQGHYLGMANPNNSPVIPPRPSQAQAYNYY